MEKFPLIKSDWLLSVGTSFNPEQEERIRLTLNAFSFLSWVVSLPFTYCQERKEKPLEEVQVVSEGELDNQVENKEKVKK